MIANKLSDYEERPQQLAMARAIEAAFNDNHHLIVEAGTGVGKSFAYLIPAVLKAISMERSARPVVISTGTIALQEQLAGKDIPFLRSVWDKEFTAVLAKGRANYLSLRRLSLAMDRVKQGVMFDMQADRDLRRIADWAGSTGDGSRTDLDFTPDAEAWRQVESDRNNCLGKNCPTYEACFFQRAKRRMYNAHVLVVNHHLLFADLALKMSGVSYLPDYRYLIIDEAHDIEKIASEHLGIHLTRSSVDYFLNSIRHHRTGKGLTSTYPRAERVLNHVSRARVLAGAYFDDVYAMLSRNADGRMRLREPGAFNTEAPMVFKDIYLGLAECARESENEDEQIEIDSAAKRALAIGDAIETFNAQSLPGQVYWIESAESRIGNNVELCAAPIHVGDLLRQHLFSKVKSVAMTSATLATASGNNAFAYLRDRLGLGRSMAGDALNHEGSPRDKDLPTSETRELLLGSPFNYQKQAVLRVPDMPEPGTPGYDESLAKEVVRAVKESKGGSFVLFTSYTQLRRTCDTVTPELTLLGYSILRQGDGVPRSRMIEMFKQGTKMVLFGTETFWQGVDVPGEALTGVIITRLPFAVPTEPLIAARMESIDRAGGNSFMDFSLPQAVIKLKQGFGRLIRRATDYGTVTILDSRVRRKPYGRRFIDALPPARLEMK